MEEKTEEPGALESRARETDHLETGSLETDPEKPLPQTLGIGEAIRRHLARPVSCDDRPASDTPPRPTLL